MESFRTDGFSVHRVFLRTAELEELQVELDRLINHDLHTIPATSVYYEDVEDPQTLKQIQQLGEHSEYFHELQHNGKFRELAAELLEGPVIPKNVQYFNKPAILGRATPAHQDGFYFMLDPCEAVTMWLALDPADEGNGCVRYVPGSHRTGMRAHGRTKTLGFSQGIVDYRDTADASDEVALSAKPGDLLAHHALTIHRADGNPSRRQRRAIGFIYYSESAKEDSEAHAAYQRQLATRLVEEKKV